MNGGVNPIIAKVINEVELKPNLLVNPTSKFVVVTYWWGRGNLNKNTQRPCPEEITEPIKWDMTDERAEDDPEFAVMYQRVADIEKIRKDKAKLNEGLTEDEKAERKAAIIAITLSLIEYFKVPKVKLALTARYDAAVKKLRDAKQFTEPQIFEVMIKEWEDKCKAAGCNYMSVNTEFGPNYQDAINGKPLFIKRALDAVQGRSVLYIDGDMWINKYPSIFDTVNVDFMARGWNSDPRGAMRYKTDVCFDPYIFETSGGTMFFGNTVNARKILDTWAKTASTKEMEGKADDRVLSMVFTERSLALTSNIIQLPIEYLWLTDNYVFHDGTDASRDDSFIEHPACLTGEERATDLGASANREPPGYGKLEKAQDCTRHGGVFYEYIFFGEGNKAMVESFRRYLDYMKNAKNFTTGDKMFEVVEFEDKFGRFNAQALKNKEAAKGVSVVLADGELAKLSTAEATIPAILANLEKGHDVEIGGSLGMPAVEVEFMCSAVNPPVVKFAVKLVVDTKAPMFISSKNPIIQNLLLMCNTLEDINVHLTESYLFVSRIRWLIKSKKSDAPGFL